MSSAGLSPDARARVGTLPRSAMRCWRRVVVVVVLAALVSPVLRDRDSFPLSTYPMYASVRPREMSIDRVVGVLANGSDRDLSMRVIADTDDPLIAEGRIRDAVLAGRADELCQRVARRVPDEVRFVLVVREVHDVVEAASGADPAVERTVHARCPSAR